MNQFTIQPFPEFFERYVRLVPEISPLEGLQQLAPRVVFSQSELEGLGDFVYAPDKWTIRQMIQHCIDTERIMAYRALRFARQDNTPLPGFEENDYAAAAEVSHRTLSDLLDEYDTVRLSTIQLFRSLRESDLLQSGEASGKLMSVLHLAYVIIGHPMHHQRIIQERYLPAARV